MDTILKYLRQLELNNNKPWFDAHRNEYLEARSHFNADGKPLKRHGKIAGGAKAGRLELLREMDDFKRAGEIEGLSIDPANNDLVVLNNRGTQIVLGMSQGPIVEEGYDREIHELYIYKRVR